MKDLVRDSFKNMEIYQVETKHYDTILNANENCEDLVALLPKEELEEMMSSLQCNRYPESDNTALRRLLQEK
jgi:hypothetical protein